MVDNMRLLVERLAAVSFSCLLPVGGVSKPLGCLSISGYESHARSLQSTISSPRIKLWVLTLNFPLFAQQHGRHVTKITTNKARNAVIRNSSGLSACNHVDIVQSNQLAHAIKSNPITGY